MISKLVNKRCTNHKFLLFPCGFSYAHHERRKCTSDHYIVYYVIEYEVAVGHPHGGMD